MKLFQVKSVLVTLTFALLASCASDVKKASLSENAIPQDEVQKSQARLENARQQQVDVAAPVPFAKAEKHLEDARTAMQKNKPSQKIKEEVEWANGQLDKAEQMASESANVLAPVLTARQAAITAQAPTVAAKDFSATDRKLKNVTDDWAPGKVKANPKDLAVIQGEYLNEELAAIKAVKLTEARSLIKNAEDMNAKKYAPQTLVEARMALTNAEKAIETDRHNMEIVDQESKAATVQARKLNDVVRISRNAKTGSSESVALAMVDRSSRLQNTETQLQRTEEDAATLEKRLAAEKQAAESERNRVGIAVADLQSQNSELAGQNEGLAAQASFNASLEKARSQFTKEEADVYRQGNNLIIRLKAINFPVSKAEIPQSGIASLDKVKSVIAELSAEKVMIEGHTDSTGSTAVNESISQKRAEAVKTYLVTEGAVSDNKVEAVGRGDVQPLTSNKTSAGRKMNRRVDVVITPSTTL